MGREVKCVAVRQHVHIKPGFFKEEILGREVGDDRCDICGLPIGLCAMLMAQERITHMVTSQEDTGIRLKSFNFCEVTSGPPTDPSQTFDYVRKTGDFSELAFNDSLIARIILDVQKGDGEDHSSTPAGKMSMLGSRLATPRRENRPFWMIASLFQDAHLATHLAREPKYLPPQMGGTGVTALFDNPDNVYYYTWAYRGGKYQRIYATACAEARECLYSLERGVQSAPILCPRLREKQEYFWGTWKNQVFIPKLGDLKGPEPPLALYLSTGGQNRYQNFENRLIRTRRAVTRSQAQVEWMHTQRLNSIFLSLFPKMKDYEEIDKDRSSILRGRYDNALSANTALQNLLKREATEKDARQLMGDHNFLMLTQGKLEFTREDALWVYYNGQGENYSLHDIVVSEDIFIRDEVSVEETFKVSGISLKPMMSYGRRTYTTKINVGLYQINDVMEDWADGLILELKGSRDKVSRPLRPEEIGPIMDKRPEWVNDDQGLIARCHRENSTSQRGGERVLLVSADRRLARQMAETCNVTVCRVDPYKYVEIATQSGRVISADMDPSFLYEWIPDIKIYLDTGSIMAAGSRCTLEGTTPMYRTVRKTGWNAGKRFSEITLTKLSTSPHIRKETHYPISRPKVWRSGSRPYESAYSSHDTWKTTRSKGTVETKLSSVKRGGAALRRKSTLSENWRVNSRPR